MNKNSYGNFIVHYTRLIFIIIHCIIFIFYNSICFLMLNHLPVIFNLNTNDIYIYNRLIGLVGRVFANGPGDRRSIPGRFILKTFLKKWYLIHPSLTLSIIKYVSRVKWSNTGKGESPSPTPRFSSY